MAIWDRLIELELKLEGYVPFTPVGIVVRHLGKRCELVLDVGCGQGQPAYTLRRHTHRLVGVDAFAPYLGVCLKNQNHWGLVRADVRWLPFRSRSVDSVVCIRVLEHLTPEQGEQLIKAIENCASRQVVLSLPVGSFERPDYHDNPFQAHLSAWTPKDFRDRGYRVYGSGLKWMNMVRLRMPGATRFLLDATWVLLGPICYYWPEVAGNMICVKDVERQCESGTTGDV